jgi:exodeoxyribonuclease-3
LVFCTKKGYSGVAIFTKVLPKHVEYGCGIEAYDNEGRVLRTDFEDFSLMSVYMPSGSSGDERQGFKFQWMNDFQGYINDLKVQIPNLIVSGDYNICHQPIDIHNPKSNANSSGFLPEEREWMGQFWKVDLLIHSVISILSLIITLGGALGQERVRTWAGVSIIIALLYP